LKKKLKFYFCLLKTYKIRHFLFLFFKSCKKNENFSSFVF